MAVFDTIAFRATVTESITGLVVPTHGREHAPRTRPRLTDDTVQEDAYTRIPTHKHRAPTLRVTHSPIDTRIPQPRATHPRTLSKFL